MISKFKDDPMPNLTPMMQQYQAIKAEHRDAILFFRLGDFYEMFGNDALEASKILDITLTARSKKENPVPMCGVPYHAAENYIARLTKAGKKVAICEQVSDPSLPGIVKRKVVRIITPGTTFSDQILQRKANHFIAAIFPQKDYFGIAFADLTTGEFQAAEIKGIDELKSEMLRIEPAEIVIHREHYDDPDIRADMIAISDSTISPCDIYEDASQYLRQEFKVTSLEGFGIANWPFAVQASAILMRYLRDTQKSSISHIDRITAYHRDQWMPLDEATIRNLELFSTLRDHAQEGTLLSVIDKTESSMGGRMIRRWLVQPLLNQLEIEARHDSVENLINDDHLRNEILENIKKLSDLERILARLSSTIGNGRDLLGLAHSLSTIPDIKSILATAKARMLLSMNEQLIELDNLVNLISRAIVEEVPMKITEGGLIQSGYNKELDELRSIMKDARTALKEIEKKEVNETGISSLKVRYNKVFGYYIEVSKSNLEKVPDHYHRKQTLVNAERFVTPELKEYEDKVLSAEERAKTLEYEIFLQIREQTLENIKAIKQNAHVLAELDVLLSFAKIAIQRNYTKPQISRDSIYEIQDGRHPVVESMTFEQSFVPNHTSFKGDDTQIKLITGPNMSGKSTYLRQVALIALMAQIGSFVPAKSVKLRIFDRIFTRVGASDNLVKGQSTFMVEMQEAAYILNHASKKSLIILDELGRGTSTYDGLSIAWATLEFLHDKIQAFTLFATHYHELIDLAEKLDNARNFSIDVKETPRGVIFLHKIREGGIDRSYGIEVAKLAGLPSLLVERANQILCSLEASKDIKYKQIPENQLDLFSKTYQSTREPGKLTHPALEKLKELDINNLTPLDALNALSELKDIKE